MILCAIEAAIDSFPRDSQAVVNAKKWFVDLKSWLIKFLRWVGEALPALIFFGVLLVVGLVCIYTNATEETIIYWGLVLQLLGMAVAIWGLLKIRNHFNKPTLRHLAYGWLKRFPKWDRRVPPKVSSLYGSILFSDDSLEQWFPDDPESSIEARMELILKNLDLLREGRSNIVKGISALSKKQEIDKNELSETIKTKEVLIKSDLEKLHTSDIFTSIVGLLWLICGIVMSTAPKLFVL
jgi:hypothetical protein